MKLYRAIFIFDQWLSLVKQMLVAENNECTCDEDHSWEHFLQ